MCGVATFGSVQSTEVPERSPVSPPPVTHNTRGKGSRSPLDPAGPGLHHLVPSGTDTEDDEIPCFRKKRRGDCPYLVYSASESDGEDD